MKSIVYDFSKTFLNQNKERDVNSVTYRDINIVGLKSKSKQVNKGKIDEFTYMIVSDTNSSRLDKAAVNNALNNLLTFKPGDYLLQPTFGNTLYQYLYEPINAYTAEKISYTVREMIMNWEPRVSINNLKIIPDIDRNRYTIQVYYTIPSLDGNKTVDVFEYSLQNVITY